MSKGTAAKRKKNRIERKRRRYWRSVGKASNEGGFSENGLYELSKNNIDRMLRGSAPIGRDGKSIALHHVEGIKNNFHNYIEILATEHTGRFKELHSFLF